MATNNAVNSGLSGTTGTGSFVGSTSPSITTSLNDTNGATWIHETATGTAVNYIDIKNNSTGNAPVVSAQGSDGNVLLQLNGQGTSGCGLQGSSTNSNPAAANVGHLVSSTVLAASAVTATRATNVDLTSISLTAGNWLVWGNLTWTSVGTTATQLFGWINTTSVTTPDASLYTSISAGAAASLSSNSGLTVPPQRLSLSGSATAFITGFLTNSSGNGTFCGGIYAVRLP